MNLRYALLLPTLLLFTACSSPKPVPHEKLKEYQTLKEACETNPPLILAKECQGFTNDLQREDALLTEMREIRGEEQKEPHYISLADKESLLSLKIHADKTLLAQKCQSEMPDIVKEDDINGAAFCLLFSDNHITEDEYIYLKKFSPRFDKNPQLLDYEHRYAQEKLTEGLKALSSGDKRSALTAFKLAANANSPEGTFLVALVYEEKQLKKAIAWHKKAITLGVDLSEVHLARLYLRIKLPKRAREWYLKAAKQKNALAQYRLFKIDSKSSSKKLQDDAHKWLERSAKNNYPQAQFVYGLQLMKQKQKEQALLWLNRAYDNGISASDFFLGKLYYEEGRYEEAFRKLILATDNGTANYLLAKMNEAGLGVEKNSVLAYRYYKRAHELNHGNHIADLKRLQKHLTKKERIAAKYIGKKEKQRRKEIAKACGNMANSKNIAKEDKVVHIIGVAAKPVGDANGFMVYGDNEQHYYMIAPDIAKKIDSYYSVNFRARSTGHPVLISSDAGTLQTLYQFKDLKVCSKKLRR